MKTRKIIAVSLVVKCSLVILCLSLFFFNYITGQLWFQALAQKDAVEKAVRAALDVNVKNNVGQTGLMYATAQGEPYLTRALLAKGADANIQTAEQGYNTALHLATWNGSFDRQAFNPELYAHGLENMHLLLEDGYANANLKNKDGNAPLHFLIYIGEIADRLDMLRMIVKYGGDINAQNKDGDTLLHLATSQSDNNGEFVGAMIKAFGPILNFSLRNKEGFTPAGYAQKLANTQVVAKFKPVLGAIQPDMKRNVEYAAESVNISKAIEAQNELLFPDVSVYDENGLTALMLAVLKNDVPLVNRFIADNNPVNAQSKDKYRFTPLHFAVMYENPQIINTLFKAQANPLIPDYKGQLAIREVLRIVEPVKQKEVLKALLQKNAREQINFKDQFGNTLLHDAVLFNKLPLIKYLVANYKADLDVNVKNNGNTTPLALADSMNRRGIANMFRRVRASAPGSRA